MISQANTKERMTQVFSSMLSETSSPAQWDNEPYLTGILNGFNEEVCVKCLTYAG